MATRQTEARGEWASSPGRPPLCLLGRSAAPCSTPNPFTPLPPPCRTASVLEAWRPARGQPVSPLAPAVSRFQPGVCRGAPGGGSGLGYPAAGAPLPHQLTSTCSAGSSNLYHVPNLEKEVFPAPPAGTGRPQPRGGGGVWGRVGSGPLPNLCKPGAVPGSPPLREPHQGPNET